MGIFQSDAGWIDHSKTKIPSRPTSMTSLSGRGVAVGASLSTVAGGGGGRTRGRHAKGAKPCAAAHHGGG